MHHQKPIAVAQYGLGPIGAEIARLILAKPWARLVEAVDIEPAKVGRDVGQVIGLGRDVGVTVAERLHGRPDVVVHTTGSRLQDVAPQLREVLERGCHVVSTCEELSFPLDPDVRETLNHVAHSHNVAIVGTGVNPGFAMDKLPLTLTGVCQDVKKVEVVRIQDASTRRESLQRKIGAGMTAAGFRTEVEAGRIASTGLRQSLTMIASGLGTTFERIVEGAIQPILAEHEVRTQFLTVHSGQVAGLHQTIFGHGRIEVSLELRMYVGAGQEATDRVIVTGTPDLHVEIRDGIHGDRAAAAIAVNCIPRIVNARPGVLTMDDIPISFR